MSIAHGLQSPANQGGGRRIALQPPMAEQAVGVEDDPGQSRAMNFLAVPRNFLLAGLILAVDEVETLAAGAGLHLG